MQRGKVAPPLATNQALIDTSSYAIMMRLIVIDLARSPVSGEQGSSGGGIGSVELG